MHAIRESPCLPEKSAVSPALPRIQVQPSVTAQDNDTRLTPFEPDSADQSCGNEKERHNPVPDVNSGTFKTKKDNRTGIARSADPLPVMSVSTANSTAVLPAKKSGSHSNGSGHAGIGET